MRTLEEYVAMIPTAPPDDIERYLDALGRKPFAVTSYRCISRDDAESRLSIFMLGAGVGLVGSRGERWGD